MIIDPDDESPGCVGTVFAIIVGIVITIVFIKTLQWIIS